MTLLPLVGAIGYALHSINEQNKAQYHLVNSVILVNQLAVKTAEEIHELERFAKQFAVLGDDRFAELYRNKESEVASKLHRLAQVMRRTELNTSVNVLLEMVASDRVVNEAGVPEDATQEQKRLKLEALFDGVNKEVWTIESQTEQYIARILSSTEEAFQEKRTTIWLIGSLVLPLSGILLFVFSYRISKPLKKLDVSIRALGQGELDRPVVIIGSADLVALGNRLEWMRNRLLQLEKQKNVFLRHVTHELKTPLSSIIEAASLLSDEVPGPINSKQKNVLGILERNADKLLTQIQQLLNFNTVRTEGITAPAQVCFQSLAARVTERLSDMARRGGVRFEADGPAAEVYTEPARLEMILTNLLTNAVDYSPAGSVVRLQWQIKEAHVIVEVADFGPGIDQSDIEHIFQPFYQGKHLKNGAIKGSGLGLSIVKECVDALDGRVEVDSAPGRGAKFTVTLPVRLTEGAHLSA